MPPVMPQCSRCGMTVVRRSIRQGWIERGLGLLSVNPFRCQLCANRFFAWELGRRYTKVRGNRRDFDRLPAKLDVTVIGGQVKASGVITELSLGGCTLEAEAFYGPGKILQLEIQLPEDDHSVRVDIAVVRTQRGRTLGIEFLQTEKKQRHHLRQYVRQLLADSAVRR